VIIIQLVFKVKHISTQKTPYLQIYLKTYTKQLEKAYILSMRVPFLAPLFFYLVCISYIENIRKNWYDLRMSDYTLLLNENIM
jgi:hypothetical protein